MNGVQVTICPPDPRLAWWPFPPDLEHAVEYIRLVRYYSIVGRAEWRMVEYNCYQKKVMRPEGGYED